MEGLHVFKTPASILNENMAKKGKTPIYELIVDGSGTNQPTFTYKVLCDRIAALGTGRCKKIAKQEAAEAMLKKLYLVTQEGAYSESSAESIDRAAESLYEEEVQRLVDQNISPPENRNITQQLLKLCREHALTTPEFMTSCSGPPHAPHFTVSCRVENYAEEGFASSKKVAKRDAVQKMIDKIKKVEESNSNLNEKVYSTPKSNNNISDCQSDSNSHLTKREKYLLSLNVVNEKLQKENTYVEKTMPPEIEEQLTIVKKSIEKLLTLI